MHTVGQSVRCHCSSARQVHGPETSGATADGRTVRLHIPVRRGLPLKAPRSSNPSISARIGCIRRFIPTRVSVRRFQRHAVYNSDIGPRQVLAAQFATEPARRAPCTTSPACRHSEHPNLTETPARGMIPASGSKQGWHTNETSLGSARGGAPVRVCHTGPAGVGATEAGAPNRRQGRRENLGRSHTARIWANVRATVRFGPRRTACSKQWHTVSGPAQPSSGTRARDIHR